MTKIIHSLSLSKRVLRRRPEFRAACGETIR